MGRVGIKPKRKVKIGWTPNFAYAIGLLTTDGCLSPDGRHLDLTSKDKEQLLNFMHCLNINVKIGRKKSITQNNIYYRIQFGDVIFYRFLVSIGLSTNKTKILENIKIPKNLFFDFLRGHFDGDGSSYSYWDPRWRSSFMFYTTFVSASKNHIYWIKDEIKKILKIKGSITKAKNQSTYHLRYAKKNSLKILKKMYYSKTVVCLGRKRLKIERVLATVGEKL